LIKEIIRVLFTSMVISKMDPSRSVTLAMAAFPELTAFFFGVVAAASCGAADFAVSTGILVCSNLKEENLIF
jgi:hypothetical protein